MHVSSLFLFCAIAISCYVQAQTPAPANTTPPPTGANTTPPPTGGSPQLQTQTVTTGPTPGAGAPRPLPGTVVPATGTPGPGVPATGTPGPGVPATGTPGPGVPAPAPGTPRPHQAPLLCDIAFLPVSDYDLLSLQNENTQQTVPENVSKEPTQAFCGHNDTLVGLCELKSCKTTAMGGMCVEVNVTGDHMVPAPNGAHAAQVTCDISYTYNATAVSETSCATSTGQYFQCQTITQPNYCQNCTLSDDPALKSS